MIGSSKGLRVETSDELGVLLIEGCRWVLAEVSLCRKIFCGITNRGMLPVEDCRETSGPLVYEQVAEPEITVAQDGCEVIEDRIVEDVGQTRLESGELAR